MKIIIAGAGEVGFHLAKLLSYESQEITLIDIDKESLAYADANLDIKVIKGLGFPVKNSIGRGDLIIRFNVKFPSRIDDTKRELIYKLLPKRNKIPKDNNLEVYYLEDYSQSHTNNSYDSDEEEGGGVQCAQQ